MGNIDRIGKKVNKSVCLFPNAVVGESEIDRQRCYQHKTMLLKPFIHLIKFILAFLSKILLFLSASSKKILDERTVDPDPIKQFLLWFNDASSSQMPLPNAMVVATADKQGKPSARVMLLKDFGDRGFIFYTNYKSRKALEMEKNASAALVFYWPDLVRQVRIEGTLEKISTEESDRYFQTRPRSSQLGAWASNQSEAVGSRAELDRRFEELERQYAGKQIPRPSHWGGYRLKPSRFEFWQGRVARLHDRVVYERHSSGSWQINRLAP
jgi:pyridoxamine 5'-phosphate oxidase